MILRVVLALIIGVFAVLPIGGADMPVVICLLNSYFRSRCCCRRFVLANNMLIVAGSLVGANGIILTEIMCKAMNRSLANVLFSGFGQQQGWAQPRVRKAKRNRSRRMTRILRSKLRARLCLCRDTEWP